METTKETALELRHLRRDLKTAIELAIVALAPNDLIDRLAAAAGVLEALSELPSDSAPAMAIIPRTVTRARSALEEWHGWEKKHVHRASA